MKTAADHSEQLQQKRRRSRNVDLGFAAVCFAGFLEVFGLGTNQTTSTVSAANHFAVCIPLLVGSALLASLVTRYGEEHPHRWRAWAVLALDVVGVVGTIGGVIGIHQMFKAVSPIAGTNFIYTCLGLLALGVVWQKAELILQSIRGKRDA